MGKIKTFFQESMAELKKVVWPSRDSVTSSTKVVIISSVMFAIFFGLIDFVLLRGLYILF